MKQMINKLKAFIVGLAVVIGFSTSVQAFATEVYVLGAPSGMITNKGQVRKALRAGKTAWSCKQQKYREAKDSLRATGKAKYVIGALKGTDDVDLAFEAAEAGKVVYKCNEQMIDGRRITNI